MKNPRRIYREKALFIGGPLDWQILDVDLDEKLHIIHKGQSELYARAILATDDEDEMMVYYVHESEIETIKKPRRLGIFTKTWLQCIDDFDLCQNPLETAKGLVDAAHEFYEKLKAITKNDKRRVKSGTDQQR